MTTRNTTVTNIYKLTEFGEQHVGYLAESDTGTTVVRLEGWTSVPIGRTTPDGRIWRMTQYGEREVGRFSDNGAIRSHGLFEGGELGWIESDGAVMRGGLIFAEEEVGRVEGAQPLAAAAALLLIFLPEDDESNRQLSRSSR